MTNRFPICAERCFKTQCPVIFSACFCQSIVYEIITECAETDCSITDATFVANYFAIQCGFGSTIATTPTATPSIKTSTTATLPISGTVTVLSTITNDPSITSTTATFEVSSIESISSVGRSAIPSSPASFTSLTPAIISPTNSAAGTGSLTAGAKAGIGIGSAIGAIALVGLALLIWRRRRNSRRTSSLSILPGQIEEEYDGGEKAELAGTDTGATARFALSPKPELPGTGQQGGAVKPATTVVELEHREDMKGWNELKSAEKHPPLAGLDHQSGRHQKLDEGRPPQFIMPTTSSIPRKSLPTPSSPSVDGDLSPSVTGPLPAISDLYPSPHSRQAVEEYEELEYQARRLQERRAIIAEKEQIAIEEEALRRRRVLQQGQRQSGT